jgi:hypothetical protein
MAESLESPDSGFQPDATETQVSNFLFAIITSNPIRDTVKVVIDDGTIKFTMKRDKFTALIRNLCSDDMANKVEMAMREYGETYVIDRAYSTLTHVSPGSLNTFSITGIRDDVMRDHEAAKASLPNMGYDKALRESYETMLNSFKPQHRNPVIGIKDYRK